MNPIIFGHDEELTGVNKAEDVADYDLGTSKTTHQEAFDIYVPFGEQRLDLPEGATVPNPNFANFLAGEGEQGLANITGPVSTDRAGFIPTGQTLPYTIAFANDPNASSTVGEIRVVSELDPNLDPRSFRLGDMQLGDIQVSIPDERGTFEGEFDFSATKGFILRVSAGIDPLSNTATWLLQAINPETGELITNPDLGILPPNDVRGAGSGFISYDAQPVEDIATATEISAQARILFNNAPPLDTPTISNLVDGAAPTTAVTVEALSEGSSDYLVKWDAQDEEFGSGVKHVTVYVAEDGGDFTIWQQQTTDTEGVFTGKAGKAYEFLALATDNAGNREIANLGVTLPDDGSGTNLGSLPNVGRSSEPTPAPASPPNPNYKTNPFFTEAKAAVPNTINTTSPSEFDSVLRPFKATAFATGIQGSHANIAPLAIAELEDDTFLISGGKNRGSLYKVDRIGGKVGSPLIELPYPVFEMELDSQGYIWATTGGGPLLQLDSSTGEIINEYGDSITQSLAVDKETGLIYLSSGNGIEIFDPATETFTHFSNLRVGNLAFAPDGNLWATRWPARGEVVQFPSKVKIPGQQANARLDKKPQLILELDTEVDSLAFGRADTQLANLLFISNNDGKLDMMNLANREYLTVAEGGSRGDIVETTSDGRLLISQSNQVDVFTPVTTPSVAFTNPADEGIVALPKGSISVTFDQEMYVGNASEAGSILNPANYTLTGEQGGNLVPKKVTYDAASNTVNLEYDALITDKYQLIVDDNLSNPDGVTLPAPYQVDFTAVSDFSALVDLEFTNTRSDRANDTVSFDIALTNKTDYDLSLPLNLVLQPGNNSDTAQPTDYGSVSDTGAYLIDLSDSLPDGVFKPGESITEQTVTIYNPDDLRFEYEPGIYTLPTNNQAPVFTSQPVKVATAGESYVYNVAANDPDGSVIGYLLYDAPKGMAVDPDGTITWNPTVDSPAEATVSLHVYDSRGGRAIQKFVVAVEGGNHSPVFSPLPKQIKGTEGKSIKLNLNATDADGDNLQYWVDNLPPGASFDSKTKIFTWLPGFDRAGTYENVRFVASDGKSEVSIATTFLISQGNQAPNLLPVSDRTFLEGDAIRVQLQASDSENDKLTFSSNLLPGGSFLNPNTGVFEWTPGFFQAGNYEIPFTVSDGKLSTTKTFNLEILNVNAAPKFDNLGDWAVAEGQTIDFRAFAFDADNPGFVPPERTAKGDLTIQEGSDPTVTYTVSGLPAGATFDKDTAIFNWKPGYSAAGEYEVTFTATDDGDGLEAKTVSKTVPIRVGDTNRPPVIEEITNPTVQRGEVLDLTINTSDADGNALTVTGTGSGGFGLPDFVTLTDNGDGSANLNIAPKDGDRGDQTVTIIATDELGAAKEYSFVVTVEAFNEKPLLEYVGNKVAVVGEAIEFDINVADLDEDTLNFSATGLPDGATLTPSNVYGRATFSWTPTAGNLGNYPITIKVEDSGNGDENEKLFSQQSFNLVVRTSNTAPVLAPVEDLTVAEGNTLSVQLQGTDADGDTLTYSANNLPKGAELDPVTGELTWTPDFKSAGTYKGIEFIVTDGHSSSSQTVNLNVTNSDRPPVLTQLPLQSTRENTELVFNLKGNDIDGDPLLYSAVSELPSGAKLDSRTGEFKWKPNYGQAGDYKLEFAVTDSNGSQDIKEFEIAVTNVNRAPSIEVKPQIVALGETLEFTLTSSDPDAETTLTYSIENLPEGATLNGETGVVKWQPSPGQTGDYVVTYQVSDGEDVAEKNALIRVEAKPSLPVVNLEFTPSFPPIPGQKVTINALADSFTEIKEVSIKVNGQQLALDKRNRGSYTPDTTGRVEVEVTATDAAGRTATKIEILKVKDPEDNAKPVVAFGLGLNGKAFSSETDIRATVNDSNLDEWVLKAEGRRQRAEGGEILATGYGNINNNVITSLDPALYSNGFYTLELTATDIKGRTSTTEIIVEVEGNDKQAQYQRVDNDLSVDFGGTSIDLTRRYDSLQRNQSGSFGNGWQSAWNFDLETDVAVRGSGKEAAQPYEAGTRLYLTTPDGSRVGFTFEPVAEKITGLTYYRPAWVADAGVNYTLESTDVLLSKAGDRFYDLESAKPYNLEAEQDTAYTLTSTDGTVYQLDATGNLQEQITGDGTRLIYSDSGILNPDTGETVRFETDKAGRLTQVTAPNGTAVIYDYDKAGNLVSARNLALGDSVRYSYGDKGLNLIAGDTGEAIAYFDTPVVKPITKNLGTASSFTGSTTAGTGENLYSFGFRDSEILSTNTGSLLLGVDLTGTDELPTIEGLTPVSTQTSADSSFALYTIDREGLNLLSVKGNGDYELQLGIAGDVNNDNAVDGVDSQLVKNALGLSAGDAGYDAKLDVNRDRTIDAADIQILGSNYGFAFNQAPVVQDSEAITHEDLSVEIPLADLAKDPEGDRVYFKTRDVEHGRVTFTPDGQTAIFKPEIGYTGTASFKLFADDGYAESDASIVEIQVSDAPLTSLDFVERNPKLEIGEQVELQMIADFTDQKDVVLPGDYLNWNSESEAVASVSDRGVITGVANGTTIFSVERNGLSGVTASRVGQAGFPNTEAELNTAIAEYYGLDVYPDASTLTVDTQRQIIVGIKGQADSADLSDDETGTRYFVNNPDVITVNEDGLITTLSEGFAEVTVIHGGAESIIPVNVETPNLGATELDADGGIVANSDGYQVMIPEGALTEDTQVDLTTLQQSELTTPLPEQFEVMGAFNLDLGEDDLAIPAQIAIPAPEGLTPGTEVFFMRDGEVPDETGTWNPLWLVEESGIVGNDGMIRTSSPPWPGVVKGDDYIISVPKFEYKVGNAYLTPEYVDFVTQAGVFLKDTGVGFAKRIPGGGVTTAVVGGIGLAYLSIPFLYKTTEIVSSLEVISVPKIGTLPFTTTAGVTINPRGIPTANIVLDDLIPVTENDPFAPPVLEQGTLDFGELEEPIVYLTGSNFLIDSDETEVSGTSFDDLTVTFNYAGNEYEGEIIPELSQDLGDNQYRIAVHAPQTVILAESRIGLTRTQLELSDIDNPNSTEPVPYSSKRTITIQPNDVELTLAPQAFNDQVSVFNALNPEEILESDLTSRDLLLAQIPVGTGGTFDDEPRDLVATKDATRAYVSLRSSGKLAVIDLLSLQQVDTKPETENVIDPIQLPEGAAPHAIATSYDDRYLYVGDYRSGTLYIVDIDSKSDTYHRVIEVINLAGAANGFHSLAVSSDSKKLFASVPGSSKEDKGKVFVFNIDPEDKPKELKDVPGQFEPNTQKWHDLIGVLEVAKGVEGISATPDPNVMVFTNRFEDFQGFGRIKITGDEPTQFAASVSYTPLGLGSTGDYFDVNEGFDTVVTSDGKYAFVAGRNARNFGSGAPSIDGPKSGSNVGIIVDPLTENAKLVAATRPIPNAWTSGISITSDDKYLFASYPGTGSVFAWDVEEMIKTLDNPGEFTIDHLGRGVDSPIFLPSTQKSATKADFSSVPIDNINPNIAIASDLQLTKESYIENKFEFGVPNGSKRAPLTIGFNPWSVTNASHRDWLDLSTVGDNNITEDLTPKFKWEFDENSDKVKEINLYVSVFPDGQGLLLGDTWDELSDLESSSILPSLTTEEKRQLLGVKDPDTGIWDYNPNRILTASWKKNDDGSSNWYFPDGTLIEDPDNLNTITNFTLPNNRTLTAGQTYYWAVEAIEENGTPSGTKIGQFETSVPEPIVKGDVFSNVTVLTHGFVPPYIQDDVIPPSFFEMADSIANPGTKTEGLVMKYDRTTGYWVPVDQNGKPVKDFPSGRDPSDDPNYLSTLKSYIAPYIAENAPLVLIPDWAEGFESATPDSGFTEAAADAFYASLVQLDQELGGEIGKDTANGFQLYDEKTGEIIRKQGSLLNSPLHFIGFSRGAVVNSEIIQRLGTFYPLAGGFTKAKNGERIGGDLQMTTLDPHDFNQPGLNLPIIGNFANFYEPKVQVWDNVTFADNYFQTVPDLNGNTLTPAGRDIPNVPNTESPDDANAPKGIDNPTTGYPLNPELGTLLGVPNHSVRLGANKNDADNYENSRAGFTKELKDTNPLAFFFDGTGAVHGQVNSWYTGTADFDLTEFPDQIYRRRGDGYYEHLFDSDFYSLRRDPRFNPWYTPDFLPKNDSNSFDLGEANAPWEGIGTGWFYSALGGGKDKRPESKTGRVPVEFDNTYDTRMRGDFAVPTLFNGNFDAVTKPDSRPLFNTVPGWSFHNQSDKLFTDKLTEWSDINGLETRPSYEVDGKTYEFPSYLEMVDYDTNQPNYAFELKPNDVITHNRFILPETGALRFDVHVPKPAALNNLNDYITIELQAEGNPDPYVLSSREIKNLIEDDTLNPGFPDDVAINPNYPAVDLREVDPIFGVDEKGIFKSTFNQPYFQSQVNRIGFASKGFETFQVDTIPDKLRGKNVTLTMKMHGSTTAYIDNIFFQNESLIMGNPALNGKEARASFNQTNTIEQPNNYLVEKPQYAVSYNDSLKTPNWVSYKLDSSWVVPNAPNPNRPNFGQDYALSFNNIPVEADYKKAPGGYSTRGHQTPRDDRFRVTQSYHTQSDQHYYIAKDQFQTFLMSNAQPEQVFASAWESLEDSLKEYISKGFNNLENTDVILNDSREVYIVAGRHDSKGKFDSNNGQFKLDIPDILWKVVLIPEKIGQDPSDITLGATAFGVWMYNENHQGADWTNPGAAQITSVNEIEELTKLDFFSNLPDYIEEIIENYTDTSIITSPPSSATLMANTNSPLESRFIVQDRSLNELSIGQNSLIDEGINRIERFHGLNLPSVSVVPINFGKIDSSKNSIFQTGMSHISPFQLDSGKIGVIESGFSEIGELKIGTPQTRSSKINLTEIGQGKISHAQVRPDHLRSSQINFNKRNPEKVGSAQDNITQIGSSEKFSSGIGRFNPNSSEISFSSSVPFEQFSSSNVHDYNLIDALNNSATNIWSDLLQSQTQLDVDFQITDLPSGQLAEATITGFDDAGKPNAGTILIDHNANGVGWFIDETPLDNSEFTAQNTDSYLLAAADSEANGKYDLLTTVLHELSHLYGFINGYEGFDENVETKDDTSKFIGDDFTATLDGEHLDKSAHPYDLLNTHLALGCVSFLPIWMLRSFKHLLPLSLRKMAANQQVMNYWLL